MLLIIFLGAGAIFTTFGCAQREKELVVYAAYGLKRSMDDIKKAFEKKHRIAIKIIYAGSGNLLMALQATRGGDIFFPSSSDYIEEAGDLVIRHRYVALHRPIVSIHKDNPKDIQSFADLAEPGIRIGLANKDMSAMGKISHKIIAESALKETLKKNTIIKISRVDALINLLNKKELDAAVIWENMLQWPEAKNLKGISIPSDINEVKEIQVAVLSCSENKKSAGLFADFVTSEGRVIFAKYGFGQKP